MLPESNLPPPPCPRCRRDMRPAEVKTAIWRGERLFVVEEVPAFVCDTCVEQFYDPGVADMLRRWTQDGFPLADAQREILVPVFSLAGYVPITHPINAEEQEIY